MSSTFYGLKTAGSSMNEIQKAIDITSNNIANVNTTGYKNRQVNFASLVSNLGGATTYSGTTVNSISIDYSQGALKSTGSFSDLAIQGPGFFTVEGDGGEVLYTRAGHFLLDAQRSLVTPEGMFVLSSGGSRITIPADAAEVEINPAGEIRLKYDDQEDYLAFDQIQLASFANPQGLASAGDNNYRETNNSGAVEYSAALATGTRTGSTSLVSGALELSKANLSQSLTDLIAYQRTFQAVSKTATAQNEILETTIGLAR